MRYRPNRNLVRRHSDGRQVNVARMRGHLFVCANACCCGRTDMKNAPLDTELIHREWLARRFRNIVHLTIGGCLGPCALANVALLLVDGRPLWWHSLNDDETVVALFDYIEAMLDADGYLPPPPALADHLFTASTWQPRPDGEPVEDRRLWRGREARPDATPSCELPPEALLARAGAQEPGGGAQEEICLGAPPPALELMRSGGPGGLPRKNGELTFEAPWQGRAFGMAVQASEGGLFPWEAFRQRLLANIAANESNGEPFDYYANWLSALEVSLLEAGIVTADEIRERAYEFEFGERQDVF